MIASSSSSKIWTFCSSDYCRFHWLKSTRSEQKLLPQDGRIKRLLDTTDVSLVPSLNPDGWDSAGKGDCNGSGKKHGMFNQVIKESILIFYSSIFRGPSSFLADKAGGNPTTMIKAVCCLYIVTSWLRQRLCFVCNFVGLTLDSAGKESRILPYNQEGEKKSVFPFRF